MPANGAPVRSSKPSKPVKIPLRTTVAALRGDPLATLLEVARAADGQLVRLDLGLLRPYLVTDPAHVQHVLRDHTSDYVRQGMFWKPLRRLFGSGILVDTPQWEHSRQRLTPLFSGRNIDALIDEMADTIRSSVEELHPRLTATDGIDAADATAAIVQRLVSRVFFSDRITREQIDRLIPAIDTAGVAVAPRLLLPSVPHIVPLPGDRAFRRSVATIDEVMYPLVRRTRAEGGAATDIAATLCRATDSSGRPLSDAQIRDDVVSMFAAGTETTATALVWFFVAVGARPDVAKRLRAEIDRVVGDDHINAAHLSQLKYLKMVLQELVRLYPVGWLIPRTAARDDVIGGFRVPAGSTMLISPYLTHRLPRYWARPDEFDPLRFGPDAPSNRHRYAYFPFGGGPHTCLGSHLFTVEAQLIVATLLNRYRIRVPDALSITPMPAASLRPRQHVRLRLLPLARASAPATRVA
jgi:enediyne biosynthesis protein E7